jgi:hypothetical protein
MYLSGNITIFHLVYNLPLFTEGIVNNYLEQEWFLKKYIFNHFLHLLTGVYIF